jgi:hypothetical protein
MNTINDNKYSKEHLNDIDNILKIEIPNIDNYYIDKKYKKICYKNKEGEWMYCKKHATKKGYVIMFTTMGNQTEMNETYVVNQLLAATKQKQVNHIQRNVLIKDSTKDNKEQKKERSIKDGRYKAGVDKGIMSTQTIPLPIKQKQIIDKVEIITNADKQKLKQPKQSNKKQRNTQKLYKQIKQNLPDVIGILKGMGYIVSEANQK